MLLSLKLVTNAQKALQTFRNLSLASRQNANLLYSCVLEAIQIGEHVMTITSLQSVLDQFVQDAQNVGHLLVVLRFVSHR